MVRLLRKYINRNGLISGVFFKTISSFPEFRSTTKASRIARGIPQDTFIDWLWWRWEGWSFNLLDKEIKDDTRWEKFFFNLSWRKTKRAYFKQQAQRTLDECVKIDWIERDTDKNIKVGHVGEEVYQFYMPFFAFFGFIGKNKFAAGILWIVIIYLTANILLPFFRPSLIKHFPVLESYICPMIEATSTNC